MDLAVEPGSSAPLLLYYVYPGIVFLCFLISSFLSVFSLQNMRHEKQSKPDTSGKTAAVGLLGTFLVTYIVQLVTLVVTTTSEKQWPPAEHTVVGSLSCLLIFGIQLCWLFGTVDVVWYPYQAAWALAFVFEAVLGTCAIVRAQSLWLRRYGVVELALTLSRCMILLILTSLPYIQTCIGAIRRESDVEHQPLLADAVNVNESGYGSATENEAASDEQPEFSWERRKREAKEVMEKRLREGGNWFTYANGFMLRAAAVGLCLLGSNVLHLLIPRQTAIIMDSLSNANGSNPWIAVAIFAALRLASSDSGIELLRQWLWVPVRFYSHEAMTRAAYSHMIHLSADFHDSKSSSDMMVAIHGGHAVSNAVESVLLQAVPMLIDMCVALIYLSATFGSYEGFITMATGTIFFIMAGRLVAESKTASRLRVNALYQEHYIRQSGLQGWQTVSAFNQIGYEDNRHANAVTNRWLREQKFILSWYVSIAFQTMVLTCGLLASAFLAVYRIQNGKATSGQFAMLLMYWSQLTSPLQFFAKLGKNMSDDFIDAERLLEIMKTKPTVENRKGARHLKFVAGHVKFNSVSFSYDGKKRIIDGVSLDIPAGQTVAFVGATGAGKSTLLKLLDRFYDVTAGSISIDGQDIRGVDLFSLRDRIGIVPQNPILFDDTIMNNVRYGRITATDEEVFDACRAACIHDKIESFTHGYKTRVGERGVKLSGGELQRVAIARAILRRPNIVLLDEATSAVDTDTEQQIQLSFRRLCQGRTTFVVAHRLSTIMNADRIVVVEEGRVVEQGSHNELIVANGRYADLWSKQVFLRPREPLDIHDLIDDRSTMPDDSCSGHTATESDKTRGVDFDSEATKTDEDESEPSEVGVSNHKKEAFTLNPVAPEFIPGGQHKTASASGMLRRDVAKAAIGSAISAEAGSFACLKADSTGQTTSEEQ
ncbi:hypothetical protein E4U42_005105 [Claviceps africana]|uniref:Heavy metal tolerance protein n=1 Tax=Claviceps africana TaxID=83212 RepID=A0A8K0JBZ0_9HYPO|nr:hypothetical protein E4U42_005105 [Claviceps africana]